MNHLLKKCKALDADQRHKIVCELNNVPVAEMGSGRNRSRDVQMDGRQVDLPIGTGTQSYANLTALETLAEVARRTDSSEKQPTEGGQMNGRITEQQQSGRLELQEQYTLDNPPLSYEQRGQREKRSEWTCSIFRELLTLVDNKDTLNSLGMNMNKSMLIRENDMSAGHFTLDQPVSRSTSPNTNMAIVTSMAAAASAFIPSMVDPLLLADDSKRESSVDHRLSHELNEANNAIPDHFFDAHEPHNNWHMDDSANVAMYSDTNMSHMETHHISPQIQYAQLTMSPSMTTTFTTEYGNGQKAIKPKNRAKFEPDRKKEVSLLRNKGACIRCRMLRKPCSLGDPCDTCKSVESARLWKGPCMRTKLAAELKMFSANLHNGLSRRDIEAFKRRGNFTNSLYQIEASHHPESGIFATFISLEAPAYPNNQSLDPGLHGDYASALRMLDGLDDLGTKLEAYAKRMSDIFFEEEPSRFVNVTLNTASRRAVEKDDALMARALNLWSMVHILIDNNIVWSMKITNINSQRGEGMNVKPEAGDREIRSQLNAVAEKKVDAMSKTVLRDLEKKLVASPPHEKFDIFIISIIVLNCVEKATWLFQSWEQESFLQQWPLNDPPSSFAPEGDRFSSILQNMLKMRNIIPQTTWSDEGILLLAQPQTASNDLAAFAEYFDALKLEISEVYARNDNAKFDIQDSRCFELRFCSKIFAPPTQLGA